MRKGKIPIERIDNMASRQVTFTKRRKGLFKKAKELSVLCDVEVGVIVFSTSDRLYEFASSSMKSILERYNGTKEKTQVLNPTLEAKLWKMEAENLRGQLEELRTNHRQLTGEDVSELSMEQIEHLEDQLEISSKTLRARKVREETNDQKASGSSRNTHDLNNTYDFFSPIELQLSQPETAEEVNSPKRE
ncbi:MADS-box transcription factor 23 [Ancistrocladus abbreviatus]